jgi:hypothetical protein
MDWIIMIEETAGGIWQYELVQAGKQQQKREEAMTE